jgi:hypothetical protein
MDKKKIVIIGVIAIFLISLLIIFASPTSAIGKIESCDVVEGTGYTLTILLEDGSRIKADFPGGSLTIGAKCKVYRSHGLAKWHFKSYVKPRDWME